MLTRELRRVPRASAVAAIGIVATLALTSGTAAAQEPPPPPYPPQAPAPQAPAPYPPQAYPPQAPAPQAPAPYPPQAYPPQAPAPYPQQAPAPYPPQAYPPQAYPPQAYPPQAYPPPVYAPQVAPTPIYIMPAPQAAAPGPRKITDWEEGEPIPAGYHNVSHVRVGLIVGGISTFVAVYLPTALAGAIVSDVGNVTNCGNACASAKPLLVPVVGPFIVVPHTNSATGSFFLVVDGLLQIAGIGMLIGGIAAPKTDLVRDEVATFKIAPTPVVFDDKGAGLGFKGTF